MKLIVARHGQTEWNLQNRVLGRTDIPLNQKGKAQAVELAENLAAIHIDHIYVSPLARAAETGKIVAEICGADLSVRDALIEHDFGAFEGVDRSDENYKRAKRNFAKRYPGSESYFDVAARVYPLLKELKNRDPEDTVRIVRAAAACRVICSYFEELDNEELATYTIPNCGYRIYEL